MVMSGTTQSNLPFTKQDYFQMLQNMYQPAQTTGMSAMEQLRNAGKKIKVSGTAMP